MVYEKSAKYLAHLIAVAAVPLLGLTACAVESPNEGEPSNGVGAEAEHVGSTAEALTTPPSGVGITQVGGASYHMKNGTGVCAYWEGAGGAVRTAACSSTASNQRFVAYQLQDGRYQICIPETLTYNPNEEECYNSGYGYYTCFPKQSYSATCLYVSKTVNGVPTAYRLGNIDLSSRLGWGDGTWDDWYSAGYFSWSAPYIEAESRRVTRDSAGMIVPGRASGNADQQWSFY